MFVSSDLWQAVVVLLFCCTQLGRCRGSSGWLTVLLLTEEMAALSSTPWQAKVKLWTNSHKEEKQRIKGKSERCDSVAVGDWGFFLYRFTDLSDSIRQYGCLKNHLSDSRLRFEGHSYHHRTLQAIILKWPFGNETWCHFSDKMTSSKQQRRAHLL